MTYKYEVDSQNAIRVWKINADEPEEGQLPFLFQPNWPCGTPWSSSEEANHWASLYVAWSQNPETAPYPPTVKAEAKTESWPFD